MHYGNKFINSCEALNVMTPVQRIVTLITFYKSCGNLAFAGALGELASPGLFAMGVRK
jgi:hypothetical protein